MFLISAVAFNHLSGIYSVGLGKTFSSRAVTYAGVATWTPLGMKWSPITLPGDIRGNPALRGPQIRRVSSMHEFKYS
jgi:hypothetical protein